MSRQPDAYRFDGVPLSPVARGTNFLVTGPTLGGIRDLLLQMLVTREREGALFITADTSGTDVLAAYEQVAGSLDSDRVGVVDCTQAGGSDASRNVRAVGSPSDLTGVGIEFAALYEQLVDGGARHVRTGIYTLAPFVMYADARGTYRFVHTLTGRVRTADGLGVCAVDPDALDDRILSSLAQAFDARVHLRRVDEDVQIRVTGLSDQPDGWHALDGIE